MSHPCAMELPAARPRPRPQNPSMSSASHETGAFRASVWETVLQLGLDVNPSVANWIFDTQHEDRVLTSLDLTHFVESPDSSPLSGRYPLTPSSLFPPIQSSDNAYDQKNHEIVHSQYLQSTNTVSLAIPSESQCLIPLASDDAHVSRLVISSTPENHSAKCDSYETDSVSMGSSKRENGKKDKGGKVETVPPVPSYAPDSSADSFFTIESTPDSTFDFSILRRRVQPFRKAPSGPSSMSASPSFDFPGYETDGGKKSKKKKSGGHDKDIRKAKSLFFRLGIKSSKGDLGKDSSKSVALKMNSPSLPSAKRFVTALNKETGAPMIALGADQLLADASSPGSGLGIDLQLRLSGELFSAPAPCISSSPQLKVPVHVGTPDSAISSPTSQAQNRLLSALTVPTLQKCSSSSFPSSSTPIVPEPGSAAIVANNRTSTSTNTTNALSYSTGAARSSIATSISTSQSHTAKPGMLSRRSSNTGFPALPIPNLSSGLSSFHLTPNKRRVLPFIGMQKFRNSASSSDSLEKEKERKREIEKERERERETKKPLISLPLNGDSNKASGLTTMTRGPSMNLPRLSIPDLSLPIKLDGSPVKPSVESGSGCPFPWLSLLTSPNGPQSSPGQASLPKSQSPSNTLRPDDTFGPMAGSMPTISSDRTSPMPRSHGIDGVGSPLSGSRLSGLSSSPNVSTYYNIPSLDPPPPSPLPDVPTDETTVPRSNGSRHLAVDVGTARTIDSSLPSPVLESSPPYGNAAIGNTKTQRSAFTNLSAAAGNALRAKVQRRPNQQGGFSKSPTNGATTPTTDSSPISIVPPSTINNMPGPIREQSSRGHESLFPSSPSHTPTTNNISRAMLSRFAWEKSSNSEWQNTYVDDGEMMEGDVFARSRGLKILDLTKGFEKTADEVIPTKRSHLAVQHVTENAPLHSSIIVDDSRYDGFAVEEYYRSTNYSGASTPMPGVYDDYPEDASHYPEDEMSIRHSRRRRSTVYISDEEEGGSNSGHGYGSKNRRRYSDSIYSRASFLDTEKSGEMRQRFLKHVETMLNERGRPTCAIPPVPRLPEEFVAEHKRAAAAARKEYMMKNTIGTGLRKVPVGSGR